MNGSVIVQFSMDNFFSLDNTMILALHEEKSEQICEILENLRQTYDDQQVPLETINQIINSMSEDNMFEWSNSDIQNFYQIAGCTK